MKDEAKTLLVQRLAELHCERVPSWLHDRLLLTAQLQAAIVADNATNQLRRRISRVITAKTVAAAFLAGPPAGPGEGSK